jgi:hypothetical protein
MPLRFTDVHPAFLNLLICHEASIVKMVNKQRVARTGTRVSSNDGQTRRREGG